MASLLITRPLPERVIEAAKARFDVTLRDSNRPTNEHDLRGALKGFDVILATLGDRFTAGIFAAVPEPRARLIANFGAGLDHIDLAAARAAGVAVTHTPGAVTEATADLAVTLLLMTARRAGEGERLVRAGRWQGWYPTELLGRQVSGGKVLGIVGMGRIGRAVARRLHHGFGMRVRYFNRSAVADPGVPAERVETLAGLLAGSDFVVVAVPGGAGTRHLLDRAALAHLPRHAVLVNIARGDVIDEEALIDLLEDGAIAGAGLDVYEREPEVPERLRALENVVLLPHLGTSVLEVRERMGMMALESALACIEGRELPNRAA